MSPVDVDRARILLRGMERDLIDVDTANGWSSTDIRQLFDAIGFMSDHLTGGAFLYWDPTMPEANIIVETCDPVAWRVVSDSVRLARESLRRNEIVL